MQQITVIFSKAVYLPDDDMKKLKTYGITFEKTDRASFESITNYIHDYILPVAEVFKEGIEHIEDYSYKKNGQTFYVYGSLWQEYIQKAEKKKVRFAVIEDDSVEFKDDELYDRYLITNKEKWEMLRATKDVVWHVLY